MILGHVEMEMQSVEIRNRINSDQESEYFRILEKSKKDFVKKKKKN